MKKSAIYIRVSTNHQIDKDSLPLQKQDMINYSKYILNINEYEVFEDAGFSGKNTSRPAFQKMLSKIKNGEFSHLLVWKIDRISRNLIDFCEMYEDLKKYNCTFISKNEQFDSSTAMGETMLKIILVFAELERKLTAERVSAVMFDRANKGLWNGAPIPLGYTWDSSSKFPIIDEVEAKTIQFIFNKYKILKSTTLVRNILNEGGFRTKRGGTWTTKTLCDIIRNPFYKGTYRYNYKQGGRGKKKDEAEWIIVDDNHPNIISTNLWEECNSIMTKNSNQKSNFKRVSRDHVFSNLLKCGECAKPLYGKNDKTSKDGYTPSLYTCSGRYNHLGCNQKTISDQIVGTFVLNFIKNIYSLKNNFTLNEIETTLLFGECFSDITGIDDNSLTVIKTLLTQKEQNIFSSNIEVETTLDDLEIESLKKDKLKYERALKRLDDLFLFNDDSMSEKDYIIKKTELKNRLKELDNKLLIHNNTTPITSDITLIAKEVILKLELAKTDTINYKSLILKISKKFLKDLFKTIISKIIIENRRILSIEFKNGLIINFLYTD